MHYLWLILVRFPLGPYLPPFSFSTKQHSSALAYSCVHFYIMEDTKGRILRNSLIHNRFESAMIAVLMLPLKWFQIKLTPVKSMKCWTKKTFMKKKKSKLKKLFTSVKDALPQKRIINKKKKWSVSIGCVFGDMSLTMTEVWNRDKYIEVRFSTLTSSMS